MSNLLDDVAVRARAVADAREALHAARRARDEAIVRARGEGPRFRNSLRAIGERADLDAAAVLRIVKPPPSTAVGQFQAAVRKYDKRSSA